MKSLIQLSNKSYPTSPATFQKDVKRILDAASKLWPDEVERKFNVCTWCSQQAYWSRVAEAVWSGLPFMLPKEEIKNLKE